MSRITNSMLTNNYLNDMQNNLKNLGTVQNQMSSGQTIRRGSDDPSGAARLMQLNADIAANKQYNANITDTSNWLDTTDTALSQAGNVLSRIRELMVKAGNGTYKEEDIKTINDEVTEDVKQLVQNLNTSFNGAYIFGGTKSTSKPLVADNNGNISYADKNGGTASATDEAQMGTKLAAEISQGITVEYNKTAVDILKFTDKTLGSIDAKSVISNIVSNLSKAADPAQTDAVKQTALGDINNKNLKEMDAIINNLLQTRSSVGTLQNRMDSAKTTNEDQNYNMTSILSSTGDIDLTEKTVEYSTIQTVYTAALQTSSKILKSTILDYI